MPARRLAGIAAILVALAACRPATGSPVGSGSAGSPLAGLGGATIALGQLQLIVAVADTPDTRARGLMGIADLGSLDGLLFVYPEPASPTFHMRDVPIPLDVAFVGPDGRVLEVRTMPVCLAAPCPAYAVPAPIRWAVEAAAGSLAGVEVGVLLEIEVAGPP